VSLGAEPVRAKQAMWISGDGDVILLAKRNESWAHVIDPANPIDRRPNTLAVRGDPEWKSSTSTASSSRSMARWSACSNFTWKSSRGVAPSLHRRPVRRRVP
jgi:hypothetical protein